MYDFPIFEEVHRERSQRICELFALIMQLISAYVFFVGIFPRRTIFRCCCRLLCVRRKGSVDFVGVCCISWNAVSGRSSDIPICSQLCCAALKLLYFFWKARPALFFSMLLMRISLRQLIPSHRCSSISSRSSLSDIRPRWCGFGCFLGLVLYPNGSPFTALMPSDLSVSREPEALHPLSFSGSPKSFTFLLYCCSILICGPVSCYDSLEPRFHA